MLEEFTDWLVEEEVSVFERWTPPRIRPQYVSTYLALLSYILTE